VERRDEIGVETTAIAELVSLEGKRVLDVGCGEGRLTAFAAERAATVYAFDPNPENVAAARSALSSEQRKRVRFAVHDAAALNLARERFDVALCGWSLWCVPVEGVVHALRNIHAALVPGGLLVDTQPIGPRPRVAATGDELGTLDMDEWIETIRAVDERVDETVATGLYEKPNERMLVIRSTFDDGPDCLEITRTWRGTRVPQPLADRLAAVRDRVTVDQQVRLRVLRRGRAYG
jgi:SAM-dependent methyltransferase